MFVSDRSNPTEILSVSAQCFDDCPILLSEVLSASML
jgi:hypothetical protein